MLQTFVRELLDCLAKEMAIDENRQKLRTTLATPLVDEMVPYIRISVTILLVIGLLTLLNLGLSVYLFRHFKVSGGHLSPVSTPISAQ